MITRLRALAAAVLATALVATVGCSDSGPEPGGGSDGPDRVTYLTGFGTGGHDAFAWVAKEKGFYRDAGLDVEIQLGAPATNAQGLISGQAQFTYSDVTQLMIQAGARRITDLRIIAAVHQSTLVAILAPEGSGVRTPKDLAGKKVGVAAGSITSTLLPAYGRLAGFDANTLEFAEATPQNLVGLLASGQVDVLSTFVITQNTVETVTGKKMVVLPVADHLPDLLGTGLTTTADYARQNPDLVRRFREASMAGLRYTIEHPDEAAKIMKANNPAVNEQGAAAEIRLMTPYVTAAPGGVVGAIDPQRAARAVTVLQQAGLVPPTLTPEQVIDFSLVPKA
ncbi:ABC transporter substrate-binding protein [Plantactinospora sp. B5E13]|uniref:ABC transporter substrate-binding protein n=1 Tax=unclassified Plantactinospora TaxID=2631981 RepID=UPI00325CB18E